MPPETIYKRIGGRYYPVGAEFHGTPLDGLWIFRDGGRSQSWICDLKTLEKQHNAMDRGAIMLHRDEACHAIAKIRHTASNLDLVNTIIMELVRTIPGESKIS